jgi:hypothetical protein
MIKSTVILTFRRRKSKELTIEHNLDEYGMSLEAAVESWHIRTKDHTAQSLCEYIKGKDPNFKCREV